MKVYGGTCIITSLKFLGVVKVVLREWDTTSNQEHFIQLFFSQSLQSCFNKLVDKNPKWCNQLKKAF